MIRLRVLPGDGAAFDTVLDEDEIVVGRSHEADLVVTDRFLSRKHARLFVADGRWMVEDLGSHNGTRLNGLPLAGATGLRHGDRVELSSSVLLVSGLGGEEESGGPSSFTESVFRPASTMLLEESTLENLESEADLRRYAERFRVLNEVHQALSSSLSLEELLDLILDRVFDHLRPEQGVLFLASSEGGYRPVARRRAEGSNEDYLESQTLIEEVAGKGMAARVVDLGIDDRFSGAESIKASGVRSLMAAPLLATEDEGALGLIMVGSRLNLREFTDEDLELLTSMAAVAAMRIRNQQLAEEAAERRRLEDEITLARKIQVSLHPTSLPRIPGYRIDAGNIPSRGVSGDFYKVVERADGAECVLLVADVSGKGMAAALLTATAEALASVSIAEGLPPERICARVSDLLIERTPQEKFLTAFLGVLEPTSGRLVWTNAGHNPAILVRTGGEVEELGATGPPLGLLPGSGYSAETSVLAPGDTLVVYTDGITEAADPSEEEYGLERLIAVCRGVSDPGEWITAVDADLNAFAQGVPFADDRTLLVAQRLVAAES